MISWPVRLHGFASAARGHEFYCQDRASIDGFLPLVTGNPYVETDAAVDNRSAGIPVTCKHRDWTVVACFHRKVDSKRIWVGSRFKGTDDRGHEAWIRFVCRFGVAAGADVPVLLEIHPQSAFYPSPLIVVHQEKHLGWKYIKGPGADKIAGGQVLDVRKFTRRAGIDVYKPREKP